MGVQNTIVIKRGDTLLLDGVFKQPDGTPMDLTSFTIKINILNDNERTIQTINSSTTTLPSSNPNIPNTSLTSLRVTEPTLGSFKLIYNETGNLKDENYYLEFVYQSSDGIIQSSRCLKLRLKNRLI